MFNESIAIELEGLAALGEALKNTFIMNLIFTFSWEAVLAADLSQHFSDPKVQLDYSPSGTHDSVVTEWTHVRVSDSSTSSPKGD